MTERIYLTQHQLSDRWKISEASLERWRNIGIGPRYLKLVGRIRYDLADILAYEQSCMRRSTSEPAIARSDRR
jgi:hypothetical protein